MNSEFPFQLMVYGYNEQNKRPLMARHKHTTCEFYYITSGSAVITVIDEKTGTEREIKFFENQLTMIRPGVLHTINSDVDLKYFVLEIGMQDLSKDPVKFLSNMNYARQFKEWRILEKKWKDVIVVNDTHNLSHLFNGFRSLQGLPPPFKSAYLEIQLKRLFLAILQCEVPDQDTKGQNIYVRYAMSYILSNFNNYITPKDVANNSRVSLTYLQRLFRETFDATLTEKIREPQIRYAAQLLEASNFSLTEIAAPSGFRSMQNFESAFRRLMGMAPREYRKRYSRKIHREIYFKDENSSQ